MGLWAYKNDKGTLPVLMTGCQRFCHVWASPIQEKIIPPKILNTPSLKTQGKSF